MKASKLARWICAVIAACHLAACATAPNFGSTTAPSGPSSSGAKSGAVIAGFALIALAAWLLNRGEQKPPSAEPPKDAVPAEGQPQAVNLPAF